MSGHSAEHETESAERSSPQAATSGVLAPAELRVLALQRSAGNRAVVRLLDRAPPSGRLLQRRRLAPTGDLLDLVTDPTAPDFAAHLAGVQRMVLAAWNELTEDEKARVRTERLGGRTEAQFKALSKGMQSIWWAHAIRKVRPGLTGTSPAAVLAAWNQMTKDRQDRVRRAAFKGLTNDQFKALPLAERNKRWLEAVRQVWAAAALGDPLLIDTPPRPSTADAANIQKLVENANKVFDRIATGAEDASIGQVFGTGKIAAARTKYAKARTRMNLLRGRNKILTDRSGYNLEVNLGGLTDPDQLTVSPDTIDNPDEKESIVTVIHEAMHAGNDDVGDKGYIDIDENTFKKMPTDKKLKNAAHFEVVPRRILGADFAFAGATFTPGSGASALTPRQQAIQAASDRFEDAWALGLNLHPMYVGLLRTPGEWTSLELRTRFGGVTAGLKFKDVLPFWSKVMKLTIHERAGINPAAGQTATNPVTRVDVALSENLIRKLARCMSAITMKEAEATTFIDAKATTAEKAAATTVDAERDLLVKLVLREKVGSITGSTDRDIRMVTVMGTVGDDFSDILKRRAPADFAD
jgi:hypothetical protein